MSRRALSFIGNQFVAPTNSEREIEDKCQIYVDHIEVPAWQGAEEVDLEPECFRYSW